MSAGGWTPARFALDLVPRWLAHARDPLGGVHECLGPAGLPVDPQGPRSLLTQARLAFTLAHLHLATGDSGLLQAALAQESFVETAFADPSGGYRAACSPGGLLPADPRGRARRSYDQSFVLLALVTLQRAAPDPGRAARIDALWDFVADGLTDPASGALREDDRPADPDAVWAQNPQMHMFEALLQAFEMSGDRRWLDRAAVFADLAGRHFIDPATGALREFLGSGWQVLPGEIGARIEPGHQYEWAWLLHRHADLSGEDTGRAAATRMADFAGRYGLRSQGPLAGAPYDALDAGGRVTEPTHLLWPLTEAGKFHAARHLTTGDPAEAGLARRCADLIFGRYLQPEAPAVPPFWVNRLDGQGATLWPEALGRLLYHIAIFVTEGNRAGLWPMAVPDPG